MINYQYQILRYTPDQVSEEFVNLGVVLFDLDNRVLSSRFVNKSSRISVVFPDASSRHLVSTLKHIKGAFHTIEERLSNELNLDKVGNIEEITGSVLPKDDSALVFSSVRHGRDVDLKAACADIFERIILRNMSDVDEVELRRDREVWNKVYKTYFERYQVAQKLHLHTIKTRNDVLRFDRAWKNGQWNCFESVALDLTRPDSVKNKVYKWVGKLDELQTSKEPVALFLLSTLPKDNDLRKFIYKKLDNKTFNKSRVKLVTEEEAEKLARKFKTEIERHS